MQRGVVWGLLGLAVGCVVLFAGAGAALGSGSNLIPNPSFESGGVYSIAGWGMTSATNTADATAEDGSWAALIQPSGSPTIYGIYVKPEAVSSASAGSQYQGSAYVRSNSPGKTVCVNLRDVTSAGSLAQPVVKTCGATTSSWVQLTTPTMSVVNTGDTVGFTVTQAAAVSTDSFEVDNTSLVQVGGQDRTAPSTPANLHTTLVTSSSVALAWTASTDPDNASPTLIYQVSRNGSVVGTTNPGVTSFTDSGLTMQTQYNYTVVALDPASNASPASGALQVTTPGPDTTAPTAPTGVTATATGSSSITVSWKASSDPDNSSSSLSYNVFHYATKIGTVAGTAPLTFTDGGFQSGTSVSYYVVAVDPTGNLSANSATVWATTTSSPRPAADWAMDEPSGSSTMLDSSANGNKGTLTNVAAGVPGFSGSGYSFTPNAYVTVPDNATLDPGYRDISITLHLKTTSLPSLGDFDLLRKGKSPLGNEYKIEMLSTGQILCAFHGAFGVGVQSTGASLADGRWHTIVCARTDWRTASLTVDGTQYTHTNGPIGSIVPTQELSIGANPVGNNDYYHGNLDDITIQIG